MEQQLSAASQLSGLANKAAKKKRTNRNIKYSIIDHELLSFLSRIARKLAHKFCLGYDSIKIMHPSDDEFNKCWGYCLGRSIVLEIRRGRRYLALEELLDTLIHEMAHLGNTDADTEKELHNDAWKKRYDTYYHWIKKGLSKGENECLFNQHLEQ